MPVALSSERETNSPLRTCHEQRHKLYSIATATSSSLTKQCDDGDCPLVKCCLAPWKPRTLAALLRAAAGSGFGGEACHDAPRKEGRAAPLRLALESAPTASFLPRGLQSNVADRRNRAALLALLQADPHAAADDGSLLQLACEKGYLDLAAALLSHGGVLGPGAPPGRPAPLHAAAEAGDRAGNFRKTPVQPQAKPRPEAKFGAPPPFGVDSVTAQATNSRFTTASSSIGSKSQSRYLGYASPAQPGAGAGPAATTAIVAAGQRPSEGQMLKKR